MLRLCQRLIVPLVCGGPDRMQSGICNGRRSLRQRLRIAGSVEAVLRFDAAQAINFMRFLHRYGGSLNGLCSFLTIFCEECYGYEDQRKGVLV
jgi:hypothetical protein